MPKSLFYIQVSMQADATGAAVTKPGKIHVEPCFQLLKENWRFMP